MNEIFKRVMNTGVTITGALIALLLSIIGLPSSASTTRSTRSELAGQGAGLASTTRAPVTGQCLVDRRAREPLILDGLRQRQSGGAQCWRLRWPAGGSLAFRAGNDALSRLCPLMLVHRLRSGL